MATVCYQSRGCDTMRTVVVPIFSIYTAQLQHSMVPLFSIPYKYCFICVVDLKKRMLTVQAKRIHQRQSVKSAEQTYEYVIEI